MKSQILLSVLIGINPAYAQVRTETQTQTAKPKVSKKVGDVSRGAKINEIKKKDNVVPEFKSIFESGKTESLTDVQPPKNSDIYSQAGNKTQATYEKALDSQIDELYQLTQKFKNSPNRGELWLRLAELYIEKAGMVNDRVQTEYDQKLADHQAGKLDKLPQLNLSQVREFNQKAVLLYEWFLRDFAGDEKTDQALFYLAYQNFEIGKPQAGLSLYQKLVKDYPNSRFATESHFALAESYFDNQKWSDAFKEYAFVLQDKKNTLYTISLYKTAWCLFRTGQIEAAITHLDQLITTGSLAAETATAGAAKKLDTVRLEGEAMNDLVVFFAETNDMERAINYFTQLEAKGGKESLIKLAYHLSSKGSYDKARKVYKHLIAQSPLDKKSFDYQYQIVQDYFFFKKDSEFKEELYTWVEGYGAQSSWYAVHKKDADFIKASDEKRELTLRNYILQQHQTAQNSRAEGPQLSAQKGYSVYFAQFPQSVVSDEMRFFYAELLYDMKAYREAAEQYQIVVSNYKTGKYHEKAAQNLMISLEKLIPKDEELQKQTENSVEPLVLSEEIKKFIQASSDYLVQYPKTDKKAEIQFRIGRLYYLTNNFTPAEQQFKEIVQKHPKTQYSEYSANLLLDIYNLKKDYSGLEKVGTELLTDQSIANTKLGDDIRNVIEKASFIKAQNLEAAKKYSESAEQYSQFAQQNPKSKLFAAALFNASVNYERAGQNKAAYEGYEKVMALNSTESQELKAQTKKLLVKMYQNTGQYEKAGVLYKELSRETPAGDGLLPNYIFNAALMAEIMMQNNEAVSDYTRYRKLATNEEEKADLLFKIAELNRKSGAALKASANYKLYTESPKAKPAQKIEAYYWTYRLAQQLKQPADYGKTISLIEKTRSEMPAEKQADVQMFEARLKLDEARELYQKLTKIQIPSQAKKQKEAVDRRLEMMNTLNDQLAEVIKINSPGEIVSALSLVAQSNENMAEAFKAAPVPADLDDESKKIYLEELNKIIEPFSKKSEQSYKLAVERGRSLKVYNDDYHFAYAKLSLKNPVEYYDNKEVFSESREVIWNVNPAQKADSKKAASALESAIAANSFELMYKEAVEVLKVTPEDAQALNVLALTHFQKKQYQAALTLLSKALDQQSKNVNLINNMAMVHLAQQSEREAILNLAQARDIDKNNLTVSVNLAYLYLQHRDYDQVLSLLEKPAADNKLDKKALQYYAIALKAKNKLKEADRIFDKISRL